MYSSIDSLENQKIIDEDEVTIEEKDPDQTEINMEWKEHSENSFDPKSKPIVFKTMAMSNPTGLINFSNDEEGKRVDVIFKDDRFSETKELNMYVNDENSDLKKALLEDHKRDSEINDEHKNESIPAESSKRSTCKFKSGSFKSNSEIFNENDKSNDINESENNINRASQPNDQADFVNSPEQIKENIEEEKNEEIDKELSNSGSDYQKEDQPQDNKSS